MGLSVPKLPDDAVKIPTGWITRGVYKARYGDEEYLEVPEECWGSNGIPDAMSPREWARVRGKRGI